MHQIKLRSMRTDEWDQVAALICQSTNHWYESRGRPPIFPAGPKSTRLFCEVYEELDPGCCVVADDGTGTIMGSCFYHPRETHVSLGIMNVHPRFMGQGVAVQLLNFVISEAEKLHKDVRLVSSAHNLDSYSLYTRAGFVPYMTFQDMLLPVPEQGIAINNENRQYVRDAQPSDVAGMVAIEMSVAGIRRDKDFRHFLENRAGYWHCSVFDRGQGIEGFLVSIAHPGSTMLGPGVMKSDAIAIALVLAELDFRRGLTPVFLIPAHCGQLVSEAYTWGARNCEIHFAQCYGETPVIDGIVMPSFMPETG